MSRTRTLFTRVFWLDAFERAVKTAGQTALTIVALDKIPDAITADWANVGRAAAIGAVLSLITSIASTPVPGVSPASALPAGA